MEFGRRQDSSKLIHGNYFNSHDEQFNVPVNVEFRLQSQGVTTR